jgi:alanine racemase
MESSRVPLRPTFMEIDLGVLVENYRALKRRAGQSKVMAVVKANAYGHGLIECARALERECGADYFGVALVEEGVRLRQAGIKAPILIFGGIFTDQVGIYLEHDLDLTASSVEKLRLIEGAAKALGKRARIHIKIDTGMGRIGVRPSSARAVFEAAHASAHCDLVGVFTHFATADEEDLTFARKQLKDFTDCLSYFQEKGKPLPLRHAANSGALLQLPESHLDMVRCGISLFGVSPSEHLNSAVAKLVKPVMKVSSRVVYFKVVRAGESVSYGRTWFAKEDSRVVTVPVGYGDGYSRALSNKAEVIIHGKRYPVVGRVCMDQIMVSLGRGEAYNGDEVILVGSQGGEKITVEDLAAHAGTIPYEVLTDLNLRIPRRYLRGGVVVAEECPQ